MRIYTFKLDDDSMIKNENNSNHLVKETSKVITPSNEIKDYSPLRFLFLAWSVFFIPNILVECLFYLTKNFLINAIPPTVGFGPLAMAFTLLEYTKREEHYNNGKIERLHYNGTRISSDSANNEILWFGQPSLFVFGTIIFYYFLIFIFSSGIVILIAQAIQIGYLSAGIKLYLIFLFIPLSLIGLIMILFGYSKIEEKKETVYEVREDCIIIRHKNKPSPISLRGLSKIQIQKNRFDFFEVKTGSIVLFNHENRKYNLTLEHIEQVDTVASLIEELLPIAS